MKMTSIDDFAIDGKYLSYDLIDYGLNATIQPPNENQQSIVNFAKFVEGASIAAVIFGFILVLFAGPLAIPFLGLVNLA